MLANFGPLVQNMGWDEWNRMNIIALETDYVTPKTPDNKYHT